MSFLKFITALFLIGLPFTGFLAGCFASDMLWQNTKSDTIDWENLGKPDVPIAKITKPQLWDVMVRTTDGRDFICTHKLPDHHCWIEASQYDGWEDDPGEIWEGPMYPKPEQVVQQIGVSYETNSEFATYVLLQDGTVHRDNFGVAPYYSVEYMGDLLLGGVIGFFITLITVAVFFRKHRDWLIDI